MVRLLPDAGLDDEIIGFHAQQAVEKALKAWLAHLGIDYPRAHSLGALVDLLVLHGHSLPPDLANADKLTPFATVFRYDDLPISSSFDRMDALRLAKGVRAFVKKMIGESAEG